MGRHAEHRAVLLGAGLGGGQSLHFGSAEIGNVDASTVAVRFNRPVAASNPATGVTIKKGGAGQTITGATIQADKRLIYYALDGPAAAGDTLTWEYNGATGNIVDDVKGTALGTVAAAGVVNHISGSTAGYAMGCLGLTYAG